jgi:hypothetical protein
MNLFLFLVFKASAWKEFPEQYHELLLYLFVSNDLLIPTHIERQWLFPTILPMGRPTNFFIDLKDSSKIVRLFKFTMIPLQFLHRLGIKLVEACWQLKERFRDVIVLMKMNDRILIEFIPQNSISVAIIGPDAIKSLTMLMETMESLGLDLKTKLRFQIFVPCVHCIQGFFYFFQPKILWIVFFFF